MQPTIDETPQPQFSWAKGEAAALPDREPRVHFKQCVRVVPIGGPPRAYRVLASNLSRQGMFLKMPTPFDTGTKVALSLEAGGQVLPFAQGEVVWRELDEPKQSGRGAGFGVRFTGFLHPRAHELVGYLVDNLGTGKPLVSPLPKSVWPRRFAWGGAGLVAVIVGAVITSAVLHLVREPGGEPSSSAAEVAVTAVQPPDDMAAPAAVEMKPTPVEVHAIEEEAAPMPKEPKPEVVEPRFKGPSESATQAAQIALAVRAAVSARAAPAPAAPRPTPKAEAPRPAADARALAIPSGAVKSLSSAVDGKQLTLTLALGAGASITRAFTLANPDRLALDVKGALPKKSYVLSGSGEVARVRVGRIAGGTRLVVDLAHAPGKPAVTGASIAIPLQ